MKGPELEVPPGPSARRGARHASDLLRVRDRLQMFLPQGTISTKPERSLLRIRQHLPRLACLPREEVK